MNLALRDIRHNLVRFSLTTVGVGLLLMIVMGMGGIYRGLIEEALLLVDRIGADLWVVQEATRGPFAEISRVPLTLEDRLRSVPGVRTARAFVSHTIQREYQGKPLRIVVQGLSWPEDRGDWLPIVAGRTLGAAHYEMVADRLLGLELGDKIPLGRDVYTVVGLTSGMVGSGGDGMAFFGAGRARDTVRPLGGVHSPCAGVAKGSCHCAGYRQDAAFPHRAHSRSFRRARCSPAIYGKRGTRAIDAGRGRGRGSTDDIRLARRLGIHK